MNNKKRAKALTKLLKKSLKLYYEIDATQGIDDTVLDSLYAFMKVLTEDIVAITGEKLDWDTV